MNIKDSRRILRKWSGMLLCAVLLCGLLGGCGEKPDSTDETTTAPTYDLNLKDSVLDGQVTRDTPVYSRPDSDSDVTATLHAGTSFSCTSLQSTEDGVWGETVFGWIRVDDYIQSEAPVDSTTPSGAGDGETILGIVTATKLNVRKGPGTENDIVSELYAGEPVTILEVVTSGKSYWGRTEDGWVAMSYVYEPGKIGKNRCNAVVMEGNVPVYDWPGIREGSTGTLKKGQRIDVLQRITMDDEVWGCFEDGWVCLEELYVEGETGKNACTGTVTATNLNVRSGPGTEFKKVTAYSKGKRVEILEQIYVDGTAWGYTGKGWVSMDYIRQETNTGTTES